MSQNAENKMMLILVVLVVAVAGISVYVAGQKSNQVTQQHVTVQQSPLPTVGLAPHTSPTYDSSNGTTSSPGPNATESRDERFDFTVFSSDKDENQDEAGGGFTILDTSTLDPMEAHQKRLQEVLNNSEDGENEFDPDAELVTVKGRAIDYETGKPMSSVTFLGHDHPEMIAPEADGTFELKLLPNTNGQGLVSFSTSDDYAEFASYESAGVQSVDLNLSDSQEAPIFSMIFFKQRNVTVKVLSEGSLDPVEGVEVIVQLPTKNMGSEVQVEKTDGRGSFEVPLIPFRNYTFSVTHTSTSKSQSVMLSSAVTKGVYYIYIPETATINGMVNRPDGKPASGITVSAYQKDSRIQQLQETETDADGSFLFPPMLAGTYEVWVEVPLNYAYVAPSEVKRVTVTSSRPETNIVFTLEEGDFVTGIVVNKEMQPIEGVTITRDGDPTNPDNIVTGPDGTFQVTGIRRGSSLPGLYFLHPDYEREVRTEVNLLDGYQEIVMTKINSVKLQVVWADDGSPVNYYAYRLLESGWNDFEMNTGKAATNVYTEDGITDLQNLENGEYRVEATLLDPVSGEMTTIRDATSFTLSEGGQNLTVKVELIGGHRVQGQLVFAGDGEPVPYTDVKFAPPSNGYMNMYRRPTQGNEAFENLRATSDAQGKFEFEGIPPGRFTLVVESPALIQNIPHDFEVVAETPPEFITIELHRGGVISGIATGIDGEPLAGASVSRAFHSANLDAWERDHTSTDENGYYEFRKVTKGTQFLGFNHSQSGLTRQDQIDVELAENFQHDFDFSDGIVVSGTITYNGEIRRSSWQVQFIRTDTVKSPSVQVGRDGSYSVRLSPGDYKLTAYGISGESDIIPLTATQTKDIDIVSLSADVVLLFPDGAEFTPGKLVISPEVLANRYMYIRRTMEQDTRHLTDFMEGKYRATFTSLDGEWSGDTEYIELYAGGENVFLIEVKETPRTLKIDTWQPDEIGVNYQRERVNITEHLKGPGRLMVYFEYEKGRHAIKLQSSAIYQNGSLVSIDTHEGWAGFDVSATRYYLNLPKYDPDATYEIESVVKGDGGSDSTGSVYLDIN